MAAQESVEHWMELSEMIWHKNPRRHDGLKLDDVALDPLCASASPSSVSETNTCETSLVDRFGKQHLGPTELRGRPLWAPMSEI